MGCSKEFEEGLKKLDHHDYYNRHKLQEVQAQVGPEVWDKWVEEQTKGIDFTSHGSMGQIRKSVSPMVWEHMVEKAVGYVDLRNRNATIKRCQELCNQSPLWDAFLRLKQEDEDFHSTEVFLNHRKFFRDPKDPTADMPSEHCLCEIRVYSGSMCAEHKDLMGVTYHYLAFDEFDLQSEEESESHQAIVKVPASNLRDRDGETIRICPHAFKRWKNGGPLKTCNVFRKLPNNRWIAVGSGRNISPEAMRSGGACPKVTHWFTAGSLGCLYCLDVIDMDHEIKYIESSVSPLDDMDILVHPRGIHDVQRCTRRNIFQPSPWVLPSPWYLDGPLAGLVFENEMPKVNRIPLAERIRSDDSSVTADEKKAIVRRKDLIMHTKVEGCDVSIAEWGELKERFIKFLEHTN